MLRAFMNDWPEIFLVHAVGLNKSTSEFVNSQTWYVSVLLVVGYIIWYLAKKHKKFYVEFVAPLSIVFIYAYLFRTYGNVDEHHATQGFFLNAAMLRGFAAMNCGVLAYYGVQRINSRAGGVTTNSKRRWALLSDAGFILVIAGAAYYNRTTYDFVFVAMLAGALILAFAEDTPHRYFDNKVIAILAELSFPIYLNHKMFRTVFKMVFPKLTLPVYLLYFVVITVYSAFTWWLVYKVLTPFFKKLIKGAACCD